MNAKKLVDLKLTREKKLAFLIERHRSYTENLSSKSGTRIVLHALKTGSLVTPVIDALNVSLYMFATPFPGTHISGHFRADQTGLVLGQNRTEVCILAPEGIGWVEIESIKIVHEV